jgi:hypothetical protein
MTTWLALPGTLLDARSLAPLQSAMGVDPGLWHVDVLGTEPALDDKIDRQAAVLAAMTAQPGGPTVVLAIPWAASCPCTWRGATLVLSQPWCCLRPMPAPALPARVPLPSALRSGKQRVSKA